MLMRKRLQPGRLPDAGGWRIEDAFGFLLPELVASRNREVGCRVVGPHHKLVVAGTQHRRDVRAERRVTAFVADHLAAVDPYGRLVVDGAEMKDDPLGDGRAKAAPVPDGVMQRPLADAGKLRLVGERHDD